MPNGESREGLEDVLELEREFLTSASRRQSVEEMIAEMRASVVRRAPPSTTDPRLPVFRDPQTPEPRFKIPKGFTPLHPSINDHAQKPDEKPVHLLRTDRVRYILRGGEKGSSLVPHLWWGDSPSQSGAIVAYKKLKKESPWVDWGNLHNLPIIDLRALNDQVPDIVTTNPEARVFVWLRDNPRPNSPAQNVRNWQWSLDGTSNDIMRYRLAERNEG